MTLFKNFFIVALLVLISACGKKVDGTYSGQDSFKVNGGQYPAQTVSITLTQQGSYVTGTYTITGGNFNGASGNLSGTVDKETITSFTLAFNSTPPQYNCTGNVSGTATVSNNKLTATLQGQLNPLQPLFGQTSPCGQIQWTLDLNKQQ